MVSKTVYVDIVNEDIGYEFRRIRAMFNNLDYERILNILADTYMHGCDKLSQVPIDFEKRPEEYHRQFGYHYLKVTMYISEDTYYRIANLPTRCRIPSREETPPLFRLVSGYGAIPPIYKEKILQGIVISPFMPNEDKFKINLWCLVENFLDCIKEKFSRPKPFILVQRRERLPSQRQAEWMERFAEVARQTAGMPLQERLKKMSELLKSGSKDDINRKIDEMKKRLNKKY